jgi:putative transposase
VKMDPFIEAEKVAGHSLKHCCELFEVSRAAFYQRRSDVPSVREVTDTELTERITVVHAASKGTYGSPRVHAELRRQGVTCGRRRVRRLMRRAGLEGRCTSRWNKTTIADPNSEAAKDLIERHFGPCTELDRRYVGDITYIRTWEGWAYLATVIDLASRRVVGWALADHMRTGLVQEALARALVTRRPDAGVIFHSDRGSQYTSRQFATFASQHGVTLSVSRTGNCFDNAVAESFFATIKRELIDVHAWPTRERLRTAVFDYVEGWYNTRRLHSSLNYRSPADYEAFINHHADRQAA